MTRGQLQKNQLQMKWQGRLKTAIHNSQEVLAQQSIYKKLISLRQSGDYKVKMDMKKKLLKLRETKLFQAAEDKIKSLEKNKLKKFEENYVKQIKKQKQKTNEMALHIMHDMKHANRLWDYSDVCLNKKLIGYKKLTLESTTYIKKVCFDFYGEHDQGSCNDTGPNFCNKCCAQHVGINFQNKRKECARNCNRLVNGEDIIPKNDESTTKTSSIHKKRHH